MLVIVYEELTSNPLSGLRDVTDWMGLEGGVDLGSPSRLQDSVGGTNPQRRPNRDSVGGGLDLPAEAKQVIAKIALNLYDEVAAESRLDPPRSP